MKFRVLALMALLSCGLQAQSYFSYVYEKSLAGAAGAVTLQQPSGAPKKAKLVGVQVYSTVATTFTLEGGTSASGSPVAVSAIAKVRPGDPTRPTLSIYADSNAAAASAVINKVVVAAGDTKTFGCIDGIEPGKAVCELTRVTGLAYTVRSSSITGDIKVTPVWIED